jgi:DNA polymerase III alpha subunit (gram-positive type)
MSDSYVVYVTDTETTGLTLDHEIIELSLLRIKIDTNFVKFDVDQKTWLIKALNPTIIEDEALAVNGHKREDILHLSQYGKDNYLHPSDAIPQMELWILDDDASAMDRVFAGHNCSFDHDRMKKMWERQDSKETFPFDCNKGNRLLDTKQLALWVDLCCGRRRTRYDLSGLVKAFNIKKEKAHRADADTRMTAELIIKFLSELGPSVREKFAECYIEQ